MPIEDSARAFITTQRVARLATVDPAGHPHIVPICFVLDGGTVYTAIDAKPKAADVRRLTRLRNIAQNPHVQVLVDLYDDVDWSRLSYVQLRGRARTIFGGDEHARAIHLLRERYPQYRAPSPYGAGLETRPVIAIDVNRAVIWP